MADELQQVQELPPEARQAIEDLRKSINAFHAARLRTNEARLGLVKTKVSPEQATQIIAAWRDPRMEEEAVQELRAFLAMLLGREPTTAEMEQGPPSGESLGILPLIAVPLIIGGAATLSTLFGYLREREVTAQAALGVAQSPWSRMQTYAVQALPWVAVAAGGWVALRMYQGKSIIPKRAPVVAAAPVEAVAVRRNRSRVEEPDDEDIEEDDEDDENDEDAEDEHDELDELENAGEPEDDEDEEEEQDDE
jgi:hypothetical protein